MEATGQPVATKQTAVIEISPADLELFHVTPDGEAQLDLTQYADTEEVTSLKAAGILDEQRSAKTFLPDFVGGLRAGRMKRERIKTDKLAEQLANDEHNRRVTEAAFERFLADESARIDHHSPYSEKSIRRYVGDLRSPASYWPEQHQEFMLEARARNDADDDVKEAAEDAKKRAKEEYIAQWIGEHGDQDLRDQYADGLLARESALKLIADTAFAGYGLEEWIPTLCQSQNCPCGRSDVQSLPREVYPRFRALKAKLPETAVLEPERIRECLRDEAEEYNYDPGQQTLPPAYGTTVKLRVGPFTFERLVKL
jgi:hypothetical protein